MPVYLLLAAAAALIAACKGTKEEETTEEGITPCPTGDDDHPLVEAHLTPSTGAADDTYSTLCTPDRVLSELADGGTLYLGAGEYSLTDPIDLTGRTGITIQAEDGVARKDVLVNTPLGAPAIISGEGSVDNTVRGMTLDGAGDTGSECFAVAGGLESLSDIDGNGLADLFSALLDIDETSQGVWTDYAGIFLKAANLFVQDVTCRDVETGLTNTNGAVFVTATDFEDMFDSSMALDQGAVYGHKRVDSSANWGASQPIIRANQATFVYLERTNLFGNETDGDDSADGTAPLIRVTDTPYFMMAGCSIVGNAVDGPVWETATLNPTGLLDPTQLQASGVLNCLVADNDVDGQIFDHSVSDQGSFVQVNNTIGSNAQSGKPVYTVDDEGNGAWTLPLLDHIGTINTNGGDGTITIVGLDAVGNTTEGELLAGVSPELHANVAFSNFWLNGNETVPGGDFVISVDPKFLGAHVYDPTADPELVVNAFHTQNLDLQNAGEYDAEFHNACTADSAGIGYEYGPHNVLATPENQCSDKSRPPVTVEEMLRARYDTL